MNKSLTLFQEPDLEFRYGQKAKDPRIGLTLFGPYDADLNTKPSTFSYLLTGTEEGLNKFRIWSQLMNMPVVDAPKDNTILWPVFPGFAAAFGEKWPLEATWHHVVDKEKLLTASRASDPYKRAYEVVQQYMEGFSVSRRLDENIGTAICVIPDEVWTNCRPESNPVKTIGTRTNRKRIDSRKAGQTEMFDDFDPLQYDLSVDFRRQLKARVMEYGIPIQIIRESTLRPTDENKFGERGLTPLSDRMWNLSSAIYYKMGGKPWKLITPREGVCYIGLAYRMVESKGGNTACCAAQMFLNTGDGVVFLGEYGPWYSPEKKQFHLNAEAARKLLSGVLDTYRSLGGKDLNEVFLHSRSEFHMDEIQGFVEACPQGVDLVAIKVRKTYGNGAPRLYRLGELPIIRGSFLKISDESGLLWGSGFKPDLLTYDGSETPLPLEIRIEYGHSPIERVAQDIFGLTKLNYNACHLGDATPVTITFSDAVGEILISNPTVESRRPNFKFYI